MFLVKKLRLDRNFLGNVNLEVSNKTACYFFQTARRRRGLSALINMGAALTPWYNDGLVKESPFVAFYLLRAHERLEERLGIWPQLQQKLSEAKAAKKQRQLTELLAVRFSSWELALTIIG